MGGEASKPAEGRAAGRPASVCAIAAEHVVLVENIPGCIALLLKKGSREILASNRLAQQVGAAPGLTCYGMTLAREHPCPFCLAPEVWRTGHPQHIEVEYGGVWYEGVWAPVSEDTYVHYVWDISERKRNGRNKEITAHAIEHAGLGHVRLDKEGRICEVNGCTCDLLGYSREELLTLTVFDVTLDLEAAAWPQHWEDMKRLGPITFEKQFRRKNGEAIPVEICSSIAEFEGEEFHHGFVRDIRDRKATEEALRQREEQLRQSQKMEAMGRLAGGIAHDFNNLLTAIIGYSDMILADQSHLSPQTREDLGEIRRAAERAADLTQQILAFSRRQTLRPRLISINSLIEDVASLLRRTLGEDIELLTSLDPGLHLTEIDPGQFTNVIMNLAVNARDAMPKGGRLTIKTENLFLDDGLARGGCAVTPGEYVCMSVLDTGIGIDPHSIPLVFEPFYTTKPPGKGTGLGLATAQGTISQSGGTMSVESTPGRGSTFHVYLPRAGHEEATDASREPEQESVRPATLARARVLVVEDEAAVRSLTSRVLTALGCEVITVADGREAMAVLDALEAPLDLLLTDLVLPGSIDGAKVVEAARRRRHDVPVLLMSGYPREVGFGCGRDSLLHFLEKPFAAEQLEAKVREALGNE